MHARGPMDPARQAGLSGGSDRASLRLLFGAPGHTASPAWGEAQGPSEAWYRVADGADSSQWAANPVADHCAWDP